MNDYFWIIIIACAYAFLMAVVWLFIKLRRKRRLEHQQRFVDHLVKAIKNDTVTSVDDITNFYRAHFDEPDMDMNNYEKLLQCMRKTLMQLAGTTKSEVKNISTKMDSLRKWTSDAQLSLAKEKKRIPFAGTPTPERQLLEDILALTSNDKEIVESKLSELAKAIRIRRETADELTQDNKRALLWARIGVIGTVIFSLISIFLTIRLAQR